MAHIAQYDEGDAQYTSRASYGAKVFRKILAFTFRLLPSNAPAFIYTTLLRPPLLRKATNTLLRKMIPASIRIPEGSLTLNPDDPVVSGALMLGAYEVIFGKIFREALAPDMTIVDIGANIGYYTLIASAHAGKDGKVIAYEPEPENLRLLERTIAKNHLENVIVVTSAVGEKTGNATLYCDPNNKGKHTLLPVEGNTPTTVQTTTLDASLENQNLHRVDVIKIDIEGWEAKAFRGMQKTLATYHPQIFFEFAPERIRETGEDPLHFLSALASFGYILEHIDEKTGMLVPIDDCMQFIKTLSGYDGYANIRLTWKKES